MLGKWLPKWVIPVLILMAIGTVWTRLLIIRTTYQIDETAQELRSLQQVKEQMELKVAGEKSPRKLEVLAKTKFGLFQPRSDQIVHVQAHPMESHDEHHGN